MTGSETSSTVDLVRCVLLGSIAALFAAGPILPSDSVAAADGAGLPLVVLWLVVTCVWSLEGLRRGRLEFRLSWCDAAMATLIAWHTASGLWAVGHAAPRPAVNMLWHWIALGAGYFLVRQMLRSNREARALAAVMIAVTCAVSTHGLYQYTVELPRTRAEYYRNPDKALAEAGVDVPPGSVDRWRFEDRLASPEPFATFALTNSLAGFLVPWLVVLAGVIVASAGRTLSPRRLLLALSCGAVPILACLVLTKSRGGLLSAAIGAVAVAALARRGPLSRSSLRWAGIAAAIFVVAAAGGIAVGILDSEMATEAVKSLGYRVEYWRSSMAMIADHPWFGSGPGNFQDLYTRYKLPEASEIVAEPHNLLLELWATAGTPAAAAFVALLACAAWATFRAMTPRDGPAQSPEPSSEASFAPPPDTSNASALRTPPPGEESDSTDGAAALLIGGASGYLLAWFLGNAPSTTFDQLLPPVLGGLAVGGVILAILRPWIRQGELTVAIPAIAATALGVNLLAAGGIGFPGVAGSFWLLMGMTLHLARDGQAGKVAGRLAGGAALACATVLLAACVASAYRPVLQCQTALLRSEFDTTHRIDHLMEAAKADPLDAEPWRRLAMVELSHWRETHDDEALKRFETALAQALSLRPNSSALYQAAGNWYLEAYEAWPAEKGAPPPGRSDLLFKAAQSYMGAVARYPNHALAHAKLAIVQQRGGNTEFARTSAATALELDARMPHWDQHLPAELRETLLLIE